MLAFFLQFDIRLASTSVYMAKIPHPIRLTGLVLSAVIVTLGTAQAQQAPATPAGTPDEKTITSSGNLPSPTWLFKAISAALPEFDWKTKVRDLTSDPNFEKSDYPDDLSKVSNLGVRLAVAFVAIMAQDYESVEKAAKVSAELSSGFSVSSDIKSKADEARDLAKEGKWDEVNSKLDLIAQDVSKELKSGAHKSEATMSFATGWLTGLNIISSALADNYSESAATLIRQGPLPGLLVEQLKAVAQNYKSNNDGKDHSNYKTITDGVTAVAETVRKDQTKPLSKEEVVALRDKSGELIKSIETLS
jgi:predicted outer membrane lipoprotein